MVVLGAISLLPALLLFYLSMTDLDLVRGSANFVGGGNYARAFQDEYFRSALRVTLLLIALPVSLQLVLGVAMALLLDNEYPLIRLIRFVFIAPMVIAPIVAGLMWKVLFLPNLGGLNSLLGAVGLPTPDWLSTGPMAITALTIVAVWQDTPFVMLLVLAALKSLPTEPLEAATVDGAGAWKQLVYIKLPLIRPVLLTALLLRIINSLSIFPIIYVLTGGGPGRSTETLNFYAYTQGFESLKIGYAGAIAVAVFVLVFVLSLGFLVLRLRESEGG
jgi:multiple sugar transport system permease protein